MKAIVVIKGDLPPLRIELARPETSGLIVGNIDGLGPLKADLSFTKLATMDGEVLNAARLNRRDILIPLVYADSYPGFTDVNITRRKVMNYFEIKSTVTLIFEMLSGKKYQISGVVQSNDVPIFTKAQGSKITVSCPNPYFIDTDTDGEITHLYGVESMFEFPFSNESLTNNMIEFGDIVTEGIANIDYKGDSTPGLLFKLYFTGEVHNIDIYNLTTKQQITIDTSRLAKVTGRKIGPGDVIELSTINEIRKRYAKLIRDGKEYNIIGCLDKFPQWIHLQGGDNKIAVSADTGIQYINMTTTHNTLYGGV